MERRVGDIGETALIDLIADRCRAVWPITKVGDIDIGDDAAVISLAGRAAIATDAVVDNVHFRREWVSADAIGRKVAARNFADIAAMGAQPVALVLAVTLPSDTQLTWFESFIDGVISECQRAGARLIGGDISSGQLFQCVGTCLGELATRAITRSGLEPGNVVAVSGAVGGAAAGLEVLTSGNAHHHAVAAVLAAYAAPIPDYSAAQAAVDAKATAMMDCSDGLIVDLGRLAAASECDISIDSMRLPIAAGTRDAAELLQVDPRLWALTGGEDHVFICGFESLAQMPAGFTMIGTCVEGSGAVWIDGEQWSQSPGFEHFRDAGRTRDA